MTVLGKSPCFIARDRNQTLRTALCGMLPGLIVNIALWGWMLKTMQEFVAPGFKFLPLESLNFTCRQEFLYLRCTVLLTVGTSLAALLYRVLGAKKACSGRLTRLIVWLDVLLTLAVCCAFVHGIQFWLKADQEHVTECPKLHRVALFYQVAFVAISACMLVPGLLTVCCFGSAGARAREGESNAYEKLLDNEAP